MNAFRRCIAATPILLMAAACSGTESSGTTGTSGAGASGGAAAGAGGGAAAGAGGGAGSGGNAGGGTTGTSGTGGSGGAAAGVGGGAGSGGNAGGSIDASIDAPDAAKADVSSDAPRETGAPDASSDGRLPCQNSTWTAGDTTGNLSFGGQNRTFALHVPAGYTGRTLVPLVLDFHGLGGTAAQEKAGSGWVTQSNQNGFVVVHPQGVGNSWNLMSGTGGCCPPAFDQNIDDVGFVRALIDKLKSEGCVDPKRIYATGLSNGGGMTLRLACDAADVIAAIAPYACDLFVSQLCAPSRPIAMIDYRGTSDNVVPYAGGVITIPVPGETRQITFLGATQTFEKFRNLNGCTGAPQTTHGNCSTYATCNQGVETTLCTVQNGGHTWGDSSVAWSVLRNYALP